MKKILSKNSLWEKLNLTILINEITYRFSGKKINLNNLVTQTLEIFQEHIIPAIKPCGT